VIIKETGLSWGDEAAREPANAVPGTLNRCGGAFSDKEFNPMRAIDKYGNMFTH